MKMLHTRIIAIDSSTLWQFHDWQTVLPAKSFRQIRALFRCKLLKRVAA